MPRVILEIEAPQLDPERYIAFLSELRSLCENTCRVSPSDVESGWITASYSNAALLTVTPREETPQALAATTPRLTLLAIIEGEPDAVVDLVQLLYTAAKRSKTRVRPIPL